MNIRNAILTLLEGEQTWRDKFRELVHAALAERPLSPSTASALEALVLLDNQYNVLTAHDLDAIADALAERDIPFLFSSGSDAGALEPRHANRPMIGKPFMDDDLKLIVLDTWSLARAQHAPEAHAGLRVARFGATD